jgi:sec-independent protein translocase protein TatA
MAFSDPIQWLVVGIIVVVIFLWGPQKIPELAKALGRARKEFDQATKEVNSAMSPTSTPTREPVSGDQMLIDTARKLGVSTEGKTREQISEELVKRFKT